MIANEFSNKIYNSYDDALAVCGNIGYDNQELTEIVVQKNIIANSLLKKDHFYDMNSMRTLLGIIWALKEKSLKVIDFGGGGGNHYFIAKNIYGNTKAINWNVVETSTMCREAEIISSKELKFFDSIDKAKSDLGDVDLIFSSSALQYTPKPLLFLDELLNCSAKYLYITRTAFSSYKDDIYSVQTSMLGANGPGPLPLGYSDRLINYPITYIHLEKFLEKIKKKYKILFLVKEESPTLFFNEFPLNEYYGIWCELLA
jgi:putative methyltransferase (TIGR04325 family)